MNLMFLFLLLGLLWSLVYSFSILAGTFKTSIFCFGWFLCFVVAFLNFKVIL